MSLGFIVVLEVLALGVWSLLPTFYIMGIQGVLKIVYDEVIHSMNIPCSKVIIKSDWFV